MNIKLTVAMAFFAGTTAMAGTRLDIVNAPCKTMGEAMAIMHQQISKSFSVGASGEDAFDNPGLAVFQFKKLGIDIPSDMIKLSKMGKTITKISKLQAGDLVFFSNPQNKKEIATMGIIQSVAADGLSFTFFYADQKQGAVRIAHSSEAEFNGWFKQGNRLATDENLNDVRKKHQEDSADIEKAKNTLTKAQAAVTSAETALKELETSFEKEYAEEFNIK